MNLRSLAKLALAILVLALTSCDTSSDTYASFSEARDDHQIEKGWLPDVLPASARDISIIRAIDVGYAEGQFTFDHADFSNFKSRLEPYSGVKSIAKSQNEKIERLRSEGYSAQMFSTDRSTWVFLCNKEEDNCEFVMW